MTTGTSLEASRPWPRADIPNDDASMPVSTWLHSIPSELVSVFYFICALQNYSVRQRVILSFTGCVRHRREATKQNVVE